MPKKRPKLPDAFREYLRALGAKGGRAAAGRAAANWWAAIPREERSRIMRERAKKRWAKARKKRSSS